MTIHVKGRNVDVTPAMKDYVEKKYREVAFFANRDVEFALASLGNDAGIIGAAKLALDAVR